MEEEKDEIEEAVDQSPMKVEVVLHYYILCEKCHAQSTHSVISGNTARAMARRDFWARVNGKTLCRECRGMRG